MKEQCREEAQRNITLPRHLVDQIVNGMCVNDCSQHGQCVNGLLLLSVRGTRTCCLKPGFHSNAIACVAFEWKPGFRLVFNVHRLLFPRAFLFLLTYLMHVHNVIGTLQMLSDDDDDDDE